MLADKITPGMRLFIAAGFCGGFSTFSTFSYESVELMRSGHTLLALLNVLISIIACFTIVYFLTRTS
jgi:fluoride exporter